MVEDEGGATCVTRFDFSSGARSSRRFSARSRSRWCRPRFGDPWGRDHADAVASAARADDWGVDPAIRAAINAHSAARSAPSSAVLTSVPEPGFAWGDAFIGAAIGVAVMCVALGCVTLVRDDGRLRST